MPDATSAPLPEPTCSNDNGTKYWHGTDPLWFIMVVPLRADKVSVSIISGQTRTYQKAKSCSSERRLNAWVESKVREFIDGHGYRPPNLT